MKTIEAPVLNHQVASHDQWLAARKELLQREKAHTREGDAIAQERLKLPWVKVEKRYVFDTPQGKKTLADLFEGRSQLIVYHFMFAPGWTEGCPSCSYLGDHFDGAQPHLKARRVTFTAISRGPLADIEPFKKRMGWKFNWASSSSNDFNFDYHVSFTDAEIKKGEGNYNFQNGPIPPLPELPGVSVFFKDADGTIYHTYSTYARGLDQFVGAYRWLDIAPLGRNEEAFDKNTMAWVRHHDKYGPDYSFDTKEGYRMPAQKAAGCCCH